MLRWDVPPRRLPIGSVVEQRQGDRRFLIVQETAGTSSTIEAWDDGIDVANRVLNLLNQTLQEMNDDMSTFNERLDVDLRATGAKIESNQRFLNELVKSAS
jgi:hypothetical protein